MKKKSTKAKVIPKEESIIANKININLDPALCNTTGSAVIFSVTSINKNIDIHITDVEFIKLQQNILNLKLNEGEQQAHK